MEVVFWLSVGLIAYVYVGYPVLLGVWARLASRRHRVTDLEDPHGPATLPAVTVIIAARNEARRLPARIENLLASDYPKDRMQIVVASDGSTDDTMDVLAPYAPRVEFIMLPPGGKAAALNAAAATARNSILVFADARQRFAPDTIRRLVRHFESPSIGAVSGELVLDCERAGRADLKVGPYEPHPQAPNVSPAAASPVAVGAGLQAGPARGQRSTIGEPAAVGADLQVGPAPGQRSTIGEPAAVGAAVGAGLQAGPLHPRSTVGDGVGAYWKYEKWLRRREAIVGSTLGVTGAVYAMRRSLWQPLPPDTILDDVLGPMRIVLRRYRVIFDATALAFDEAAKDVATETQRKVRTLAGNFQLLALEPRLLVPGVNPVWLQFMSHKVGRLAVPYALVAVFVSSAWLASASWLYAFAFASQLAFYGLAAYGAVLDHRRRGTAPLTEVAREAA